MCITKKEIHIGLEIESRINQLNISKSEFGRRLGKQKQNLKRIFERSSIDTDMLLQISKILDYNFFRLYCEEIPDIATIKVKSKGDNSPAIGGKDITYNSFSKDDSGDKIKLLEALVEDKDERIKELKERIAELKQNK